MKKLSKSNSIYGAPMGRINYGTPSCPVFLFHVPINSGGYDSGGYYWGLGKKLYCAHGNEYQEFVRANSRKEAAEELKITELLARGSK